MKRCLITGCLGFTGRYLIDLLRKQKGLHLCGVDLQTDSEEGIPCDYHHLNLSNRKNVIKVIRNIKPHIIFHLAGRMFAKRYESYYRANIKGTINLLDALLEIRENYQNDPIFVNVGSSAEYGKVGRRDLPVSESTPLRPVHYYGISKMVQGLVALQYHSIFDMNIIHVRSFNLIGPGQSSHFVSGSIARQIVALESRKKDRPQVKAGHLKSVRDFVDVRDAVRAYWLLAKKGRPGEIYNVCSGRGTSVSQVIQLILKSVEFPVQIVRDRATSGNDEVPIQIGDNSKIRSIGWKPKITIEKSLKDMVLWLKKQSD